MPDVLAEISAFVYHLLGCACGGGVCDPSPHHHRKGQGLSLYGEGLVVLSIAFGLLLFLFVIVLGGIAFFMRQAALRDASYGPRHGANPYDWERDGL